MLPCTSCICGTWRPAAKATYPPVAPVLPLLYCISTASQRWKREFSFKGGRKLSWEYEAPPAWGEKKKKIPLGCRSGVCATVHIRTHKSPSVWLAKWKHRWAGRWRLLVYKHPLSRSWRCSDKASLAIGSKLRTYGATLGLAHWISHMNSSPLSMMKFLILF